MGASGWGRGCSSWGGVRRPGADQAIAEELGHPAPRRQLVLPTDDAVPLVLEDQEVHGPAQSPERGGDLLRLGDGDPRIVAPMDEEERGSDLAGVAGRGDRLEELAVGGQAAILRLPEPPPPDPGVLQERDEV